MIVWKLDEHLKSRVVDPYREQLFLYFRLLLFTEFAEESAANLRATLADFFPEILALRFRLNKL